MNKKTVIGLLILLTVIVAGISTYIIIDQYQAKQESIRQEEAARLLAEEQAKKQIEIQALAEKVLALFDNEDKVFLAADITEEKIKEISDMISIQEGENLNDESMLLLNSILIDFRQAKAMFNIQEGIASLTPESLLTEEGAAQLNEIQTALNEKIDLDTKALFIEQQQALIDELKAQVQSTS